MQHGESYGPVASRTVSRVFHSQVDIVPMALTQSARGGGVAVLSGFDHRNPKHPKIVISSDGAGPGATPSGIAKLRGRGDDPRGCGRPGCGFVGPGIAASTRLPRADSSCRDTSRAGRRATAGRRRETKERYTSTAKRRTPLDFRTPHTPHRTSHSLTRIATEKKTRFESFFSRLLSRIHSLCHSTHSTLTLAT